MKLSRRRFLKIGAAVLASAATTGVYAAQVEPASAQIVYKSFTLPRLHPAFDGYRLAQISDIHMGTGMTRGRLLHMMEQLNAQAPDAVVITGDFVTRSTVQTIQDDLITGLSTIQSQDGVYAVLGNHDHWTDAGVVRRVLQASGATELENTAIRLQRGSAVLHLAGVDDHWVRASRLEAVLALLPDDDQAAILLAHEPDFADISAASNRFDLQLSGHSHAGQFLIPFLNRPIVTPKHGHKYPVGQYQVGSLIQYTNRGLGTIYPAIRLNCPPEITVITLRSLLS
jgi:uncharacterized protein